MMKRKIVLISAIMIFLATPCAFAQKSQEKDDLSLFEIDRLIRRTEYDEALKQLNIYIEKNPEKFDAAQTRIKRIMHARNQYSILAEKLIKLIQTDPGNNKEIYEITAQLEKFEKHPSDQNLQFIADLKKSAEFNYFRALFLEIQNATAELSHKGDYIAAVEKAKEGFWLYRDDFYETQEENEAIISAVDKTLAELDLRISEFEEKNYLPRFNTAVSEFIKAVRAEQYDLAVSRLTEVENYFRNYNELRNGIVKAGNDLQAEFAEVQKLNSDLTDASFLPFMFRFVFGVESVPDSGILGAVNSQWNDATGRMNEAVYSVLLKKYGTYETEINAGLVNEVSRYNGLEKRVLDIYKIAEANPSAGHNIQNPYQPYYALCDYAQNLCTNALRLSGVYTQVRNTGAEQEKTLAKITNGNAEASEIRALFDSSSNLSKIIGDKESQKLEGFAWTLAYNTAAEQAGRRDFDGLSNLYSQMLDSVFADTAAIFNRSWTEITNYYKASSDSVYQNALAYYNSSEKYRAGFFTKIPQNVLAELRADISKSVVYEDTFNQDPELDFGIYYSYPDLAIQISNYTQTSAQNGIKTIDGYEAIIVENYGAQSQTVEGALEVDGLIAETRASLEEDRQKLRSLISGAQEQVAVARRQMNAAQLARNEADIRFNEAQNALRNNDFDTARKKLQDALSKYDESLTNQNDEVLRSETDRKLQALGENIAKAENEVVVREVRDLKTRAKDAYFNGRFDDAEKYLNQAKIRWAVTNVDEDEEITNLLNFVNTAISMKTGREILPSAPQYPEMSQLLNISYQYFDEGSRKIGEGDRAAGEADLALALESIQKLQYVYPLNQEASILTLRINRLLDPKKFSEEFAQKIDMAKMMCKSKDTQQEGYANLLDYYQLDPNYKGLKDLIYQVEIDIGIRQKPVSNSGANRAKRLVADAQKIYNSAGNDQAKLQNALSKIDEALALVSDNQEAMALKDRITTKIGGNTATVLSTEDERLYQLAIQRLQNNNVVGANAIVEQLLKKPQNGNSQKIKDLKNKIEARS